MASRISADKLGLILGPEGIGWARMALDFVDQDGARNAVASVIGMT
jgi:hypothetical protein